MTEAPQQPRASVLLVDDKHENLLALRAILEPLDQDLVDARSGEEALKALLTRDFAAILLDVQMPELDGFETAELIKGRERTRHVPIIFLTALSKDERAVFRGYLTGAVDYMLKPFDPDILRSKVSVFIELWRKNEQIKRQEEQLREQALAALRAESEERYRELANAMPQIVWTSSPDGAATYYNRRWFEYTGLTEKQSGADAWRRVVHADDLELVLDRRAATLASGDVFEVEYRFRAGDGTYRWHLGRAVPIRREDGTIESWVGTATDIDEHRRAQDAQRFLVEASMILGSSLDYVSTLRSVADLAVREIADWCAIDMLDEEGELRQLVIAHADPRKRAFAQELQERYPPRREADPSSRVIKTGKTELVSEISDEMRAAIAVDDLHLQIIRELGLTSYLCVPLEARGRRIGAISFVAAESGRRLGERDRWLAEELARRAGTAIDNAQLYREVEERAQAARVLASVGDGVFLVASDGTVRIWNTAAEAITGATRAEVVGRPVGEAIGGWEAVGPRIPIADAPGFVSAETVPVEVRDRELWLSISGVGYADGTVYAFRDLTEERALEVMRQDIVATVSHELRTPLAAVYGSAVTLRRADIDLGDEMRERLLDVISEESERLAAIVNDLLTASQLDSGKIQLEVEQCDARAIAEGVISSAETHLPAGITLQLEAAKRLPKVEADPGQLRQVLSNLVENAIKYSPEGGRIRLSIEPADSHLRVAVSDEGLGIPAAEQRRVFEKFYRLDPGMTRGIGGTGLGLYICRELVRRVGGRIWVESAEGRGSTFFVEVPAAASAAKAKAKAVAS